MLPCATGLALTHLDCRDHFCLCDIIEQQQQHPHDYQANNTAAPVGMAHNGGGSCTSRATKPVGAASGVYIWPYNGSSFPPFNNNGCELFSDGLGMAMPELPPSSATAQVCSNGFQAAIPPVTPTPAAQLAQLALDDNQQPQATIGTASGGGSCNSSATGPIGVACGAHSWPHIRSTNCSEDNPFISCLSNDDDLFSGGINSPCPDPAPPSPQAYSNGFLGSSSFEAANLRAAPATPTTAAQYARPVRYNQQPCAPIGTGRPASSAGVKKRKSIYCQWRRATKHVLRDGRKGVLLHKIINKVVVDKMVFDKELLKELGLLRLSESDACKHFGFSRKSFKRYCRASGIDNWRDVREPYARL